MSKKGIRRCAIHWTAGSGKANNTDKSCYHYLIESDGKIVNGNCIPEDNANCNDGKYAPHLGGGNTGSIGVSLCGMHGFSYNWSASKPKSVGNYPLQAIQCESAWKLIATLCKQYSIDITPETVFTHYEFGKSHPKTSSAGKSDIVYLPYQPQLKPDQVGDFIRNKVLWYYQRI